MSMLELITLPLAAASDKGMSWLQTVQAGGVIGYIILALSVGALALVIMHLVQIRRSGLLPAPQLQALDEMLSRGDIAGALEFALSPDNDSYLTRVVAGGLSRYQKSAFGAFEFKNAIEEASDEQVARLYRSTDALGVIGSIAPLLGLLGTVQGMIGAFETLSLSAGAAHEELAANISLALITTFMGLILAIPCVTLFSFFRNRIDAFASDASGEIERLMLHLESVAVPRPAVAPRAVRPVPAVPAVPAPAVPLAPPASGATPAPSGASTPAIPAPGSTGRAPS